MEIKNVGQLLQHLASKAGVQADDKNLINALSNAELTKAPLHSDFVKSIDENLLSIDAAGDNHPVLSAKYKSQALNAFDKKMQQLIDGMDISDDDKKELTDIRSSYNRFEAVTAKINDLAKAKVTAASKSDNKALQDAIDDLQKQLKGANDKVKETEAASDKKVSEAKTDFLFRSKLSGRKTIYDQLDSDPRHSSLMILINKTLQEKGAQVEYDEKGDAVLVKADGSKLYGANHIPETLDDLIDSTLAKNKILVVSDPPKNPAQQQQNGQFQVIPGGQSSAPSGTNQSVANFARQQREAFLRNQPAET